MCSVVAESKDCLEGASVQKSAPEGTHLPCLVANTHGRRGTYSQKVPSRVWRNRREREMGHYSEALGEKLPGGFALGLDPRSQLLPLQVST